MSPALAWSHAPAETQSFAVIMDDPDAAMGRGGNHWIMYDIRASAKAVARGDADQPGKLVGGKDHRLAEASIMARYQRSADGRALLSAE